MSSPILDYFAWDHLPDPLRQVSAKIGTLARDLDDTLPNGPEKSAGLRKLLEAKDCFVRAALDTRPPAECSKPEMTVTGPFVYCDDPHCPAHGAGREEVKP